MHFDAIFRRNARVTSVRITRAMLNDVLTPAIFIKSKPRFGLAGGSQGPLSGADASCSARRRRSSWEKFEAEVLSGRY
jgi:hypothetical protein